MYFLLLSFKVHLHRILEANIVKMQIFNLLYIYLRFLLCLQSFFLLQLMMVFGWIPQFFNQVFFLNNK